MAMKTVGHVALTLAFNREGNKWVGTCVELGTSTFARTLKQCLVDLRELVLEHLDLLEESGERDRFFQTWGIHIQTTKTLPREGLVIRGLSKDWVRQIQKGGTTELGPFFQPNLFRVREDPRRALTQADV